MSSTPAEEETPVEQTVSIAPEEGLHARPAAQFVGRAQEFTADIAVTKDGRSADAKSMLTIMTLGARKGDEITISAAGSDATAAVEALVALIGTEPDA